MGEDVTAETSDPKVRPLSDIKVHTLRTTFFWPLTLDRMPGDTAVLNSVEFLALQEKWLEGSAWQRVEDGLHHLPASQESAGDPDLAAATDRNMAMANAYGEFVYFHDFVQRMLFGKTGGKGAGPLRLFQRTDIATLKVKFFNGTQIFDVERVNLYILAYGVAVVAVQVSARSSPALTLESALRINDTVRRSHVPYYFQKKRRINLGGLPVSVTWTPRDGAPVVFDLSREGVETSPPRGRKTKRSPEIHICTPYGDLFTTPPGDDRRVLPVRHWRWLLNGAEDAPECIPLKEARESYRWRHFSDDRFPILTTVILEGRDDYYGLSEGHWMRLAFVDPPGTDPHPHAPAFLRETFARHCYDRYHHDAGATADEPTRYLMCDYGMTAVTYRRGPRKDEKDPTKTVIKDNDFAATLQMHMQRHYYQMFLLQVIDKAVMLGLSSRITRAVERFDDRERESELSVSLQDIERDFLQYVHRFRFTGVSGQLQATELHNKLRDVMGLEGMFQDIKTELETAIGFLSERESEHATEAAERLNIVASLGVVIALVLGFLSMNIVTDTAMIEAIVAHTPWARMESPPLLLRHLLAFSVALIFISGAAWALSKAIEFNVGRGGKRPRRSERFVRRSLGVMVFVGGLIAFFVLTLPAVTQ